MSTLPRASARALEPDPQRRLDPVLVDPVLDEERATLANARECLAAMRERAEALARRVGSDYALDAHTNAAVLGALATRVDALTDDPTTPLFFGRLDFEAAEPNDDGPSTVHIGRRHVRDESGDPVVVDWRAGISRAFYRATPTDPMGIRRRRRFGFAGGELTAYEDERLDRPAATTVSALLAAEIERPRSGPMRDIVATIQPDQDDLVRAPLEQSVCVQGAPGTGKTAVGLHRAAYLLFTHRKRLQRAGVLVVGPNRSFLRYIAQVLPALGELDVMQTTVEELVGSVAVRGVDPPEVARLKGDARFAAVLAAAVDGAVQRPSEPLVLSVGSRRIRLTPDDLDGVLAELRAKRLRYGAARALLPALVAGVVLRRLEQEGSAPSEAVRRSVASARPVKAFVDATWPALDPAGLVARLLSDARALSAAADGVLEPAEQALLLRPPARSVRSTRWTAEDAVLVDEARDLLVRTAGFGHVVVDEAQDLSPMQCRAVGRRCVSGSATVLGDLAQATNVAAPSDWSATLAHLGKPDARLEPLTRGYRVPAEVLALANRLLPYIATGVAAATSVIRSPGSLTIRRVEPGHLVAAAVEELAAAVSQGSTALIAADALVPPLARALQAAGVPCSRLDFAEAGPVQLVPATLAKGLEFDAVVVLEPADIVSAEPRGLARLYVVLTRAVSRLTVVHAAPLPEPLTDGST